MHAVKAKPSGPPLAKAEFEALAEFRYQLRRFLRFSEQVTRESGITPLQYQLMLQIKGFPGRDWATVGELAERLQAQHHGVVALVSRCESLGLVQRRASPSDVPSSPVPTTRNHSLQRFHRRYWARPSASMA